MVVEGNLKQCSGALGHCRHYLAHLYRLYHAVLRLGNVTLPGLVMLGITRTVPQSAKERGLEVPRIKLGALSVLGMHSSSFVDFFLLRL